MLGSESTCTWICPDDRHLALRAKLKSGWSVRSSQVSRKDAPKYSTNELDKIRNVLEKAHLLEELEQERIGCLVRKLNTLQRNSKGDGNLTCILCAEQIKKFMRSAPIICKDCNKKVCNKCCIDYHSGIRPTESKQSIQSPNFLWLCRICCENRELWKRSGAWFFNAIPQYKLPPPSPTLERRRYINPNGPPAALSSLSKRKDLVPESPGNEKGHYRSMSGGSIKSFQWAKPTKPHFTSSSEPEDSSDDDGITLGKTKKTHPRIVSDSSAASVASFEKQTYSPSASPGVSRRGSNRRTFRGRQNPVKLDTPDAASTDTPTDNTRLTVNMSNLHSGSNGNLETATDATFINYKGDRGAIEFTLTYESAKCALHIGILRASNLIGMDLDGLSDPYVKLHLLPGTSRATKLRTKTRNKTLNPVFNEMLTYWGVMNDELPRRKLLLTVLDEDRFGHDFIGEIAVPLANLTPNEKKSFALPLGAPYTLKEEEKQPLDPGRIHLGMRYNISEHCLVVKILRCVNLVPRKKEQDAINPFVKVTLSLDDHRSTTYKTEIRKKTANPTFDKEMRFQVSADNGQAELARGSLSVAVMHKDAIGHDTIGSVKIGITSSGEQLKQWFNCLKHADQEFDAWHVLSNDGTGKKAKGKS